ncbi:MAG: hypothetical protein ACT4OJ_11920 [Bacteroidota bacterium]
MRKLIFLFLAVSLFAACNNDKGKVNRDDRKTDRDKDDYRDRDEDAKDKDTKSTDYIDDKEKPNDDNDKSGGWSSSDVNIFVDNCADEAVKGGMQRGKATDYCECMQRKLEVMYPNSQDVGNINVDSDEMQAMVKKCLGM